MGIFSKKKSSNVMANGYANLALPKFYKSEKSYVMEQPKAAWTDLDYANVCEESYMKNPIAYRCIQLIAKSASFIPLVLESQNGERTSRDNVESLFKSSNTLFETLYSYYLLSGNAYLFFNRDDQTLHPIRPNFVKVLVSDKTGEIMGYRIIQNKSEKDYMMSKDGCDILHVKNFHPISEYYGMSPISCARYAIDQHNDLSAYNKSLLQNSARPSGALVVKGEDGRGATLTNEQFDRIKDQIDEQFTGSRNTGRPMILEGGLDWREMSISPREMDFIENKHVVSREIALSFGVPPQLLGIPGDNTYSNMMEARLALWEQTIIPLISQITQSLNVWLDSHVSLEGATLTYDKNAIAILSSKRQDEWNRISAATFLTDEEKKSMLGL